jgi:hypothetical protein
MNKNVIPQDIRNPKYVLLFEDWKGAFIKMNSKTMQKLLEKYYPDPFALVTAKDTANAKYEERSKFRYYVKYDVHKSTSQLPNGRTQYVYGITLDFRDRLTGEDLGSPGEPLPTVAKAIKYFGEFVEKYR